MTDALISPVPRIAPVSAEALDRAVALLRAGQLVAFPTETVYGLGADASNPEAVARIFAAKGRPNDHPVIVHVAPGNDLCAWAASISPDARTLIDAFWPGPLTLILPRAAGVPDAVTGGQDTVGVRCPSHPVAQALLSAFGGGVAAPSANRFGRVSPTTAQHVAEEFGPELSLVLDGGPCEVGIESTIVDVTGDTPVLLRPGHISTAMLAGALRKPVLTRAELDARMNVGAQAAREVPRVSGALAAHYAPRTPLERVPTGALDLRARMLVAAGRRVGVWSTVKPAADVMWVAAPLDPVAYAQDLYAMLRFLDTQGCDILLVDALPDTDAWAAVNDRLGRAVVGSGDG
jgi:L-threonylcarbamoyladenylate synthase